MVNRTTLMAATLLCLIGCGQEPKKDEAPPRPVSTQAEPAKTAAPSGPPYPRPPSMAAWNHPARACEVLAAQGFKMSGWLPNPKASPGHDHMCFSSPRAAQADSAYDMTYGATGDMGHGGEVKAYVLRLRGPRPGPNLAKAREEFAEVVMTLGNAGWHFDLGQPKEERALRAAVKSGTPGSWPAGGFSRVEVAQEGKGSEDLVVTFFDPRAKPTTALEALR